jgi:hypothetical protein
MLLDMPSKRKRIATLELPFRIDASPESSRSSEAVRDQAGQEQSLRITAAEIRNDPLIQKALRIFERTIGRSTKEPAGGRKKTDLPLPDLHNGDRGAGSRAESRSGSAVQAAVPPGFEAAHEEWLSQHAGGFNRHVGYGDAAFYDTRYWTLVRKAILERDGFKCFRCSEAATQVHHLHYRFKREDHLHPEALVSICRPCHGLVEYARNARDLVSQIQSRIHRCQGFVDGMRGCEDQNPVKVYSRLIEYRKRLSELRGLYESKTGYTRAIESEDEKAFRAQSRVVLSLSEESLEIHHRATLLINAWDGSDREKAARIIPLLEREMEDCLEFEKLVLKPVAK